MRQRQTAAAAVWLDVDLRTVEEHLALDEALLEQAHEGTIATTVVRTWMAGEPTVIVGSSSRLEDEVDVEACRRAGARILRRTSGGLAVVIGPGCLMWSVVQPHPAGPPPIERLHARMLDPLAGGLSTLVDAPGGVTRRGSDGPVLTFPKARHHVQRTNMETASAPNEREKASYLVRTVGPLSGADLHLVDGGEEILPGVFVEPSDGHTTGLQTVRVGAGDGAVVFVADMFPTAAHVPPAWTMGYDLCPRTLMKEKRAILERAVRSGWALVLEHDPFRDAVRVMEKDGRFEAAEDVAIQ